MSPVALPTSRILRGANAVGALQRGPDKVWKYPKPWTPNTIPGLIFWLDGAQDVGVVPEGTVSAYTEHSPAGRVFTNNPGDWGPYYITSVKKHYFDTYRSLQFPNFDLGSAGFTFAVSNKVEPVNYPMLMVHGPDANGYELRYGGGSYANELVLDYSITGIVWTHSVADVAGEETVHILRVKPGVGSSFLGNNPAVVSAGGAPPVIHAPGTMWIGRRTGGYNYKGYVSEALVYDTALSDADMLLLHAYLRQKWSGT